MAINIRNPKGRDAVVAFEAVIPQRDVHFVDEKGKPVTTQKLLKTDIEHDLDALLKKKRGNINALAKRLASYHVKTIEPAFIKQAEILAQAAGALAGAVKMLRKTRKLTDLQSHIIEVHRLENVGDDNHLAALSKLFQGNADPLHVIKWKEFFSFIEAAIDGCEDATNVIERIILKNG